MIETCDKQNQWILTKRYIETIKYINQKNKIFQIKSIRGDFMIIYLRKIVRFITAEYMLYNNSNGGEIVLIRALIVTVKLTFLALVLWNIVNPKCSSFPSLSEVRNQLIDIAPWSSAVAGATYLALYDRFKSQWTYLANLYNQIKQTEVEMETRIDEKKEKLAQWKAGFIEDAVEMHLHTKGNIASIIFGWKNDPIKNAFKNYSPNGCRWWQIEKEVEIAYKKEVTRNVNMLLIKEKIEIKN
jgi:hypothetical protein